MEDLKKNIAGEWFDIREKADDVYDLEEFYSPTKADLKQLIAEIRLCVEEGIVEYKKGTLLPLFTFLDSLKYDSRGLETLKAESTKLAPLLYSILMQRLICRGTIQLRKGKKGSDLKIDKDIKEIIQEINEKVKENPGLNQHQAVKNIFMQMGMYKKELQDMKKLSPNIPPDKASAFFANFKGRFDTITQSIHENYASLLKEEQEKLREKSLANPLSAFDLLPLAKLCAAQAQQAARLRSTLNFAIKDGFRTREYLTNLLKEKASIMQPFDRESELYLSMGGSQKSGKRIGKLFGAELIHVLEKQMSRIE
jgi:hypothetical protein